MGRRFSQDGDGESKDTKAVKDDRGVVKKAEDMYTKGVHHAVGNEDCGIYANCLAGSGSVL